MELNWKFMSIKILVVNGLDLSNKKCELLSNVVDERSSGASIGSRLSGLCHDAIHEFYSFNNFQDQLGFV